jgi:two-component system NtrC family sensor kinase
LLTAQGTEALAVRAFREGVSDYLSEPFTVETLLQQVRVTLDKAASRASASPDAVPDTKTALFDRTGGDGDKLGAVLHAIEDPVLVMDEAGCLLLHNAAARSLFGIPDGYAGLADNVVDDAGMHLLLTAPQPQRAEVLIDEQRAFIAQMAPVPGVGRVIVMHNVSALKELDRLKTNFVASVSQDLRSPLTAILGYVELLGRAGPLTEQQRQFVDRIVISAHTITNLIADLLDLSRIEATGLDAANEIVNLAQVVEYALATVEGEVRARQQRLSIQLDAQALPVFGSPPRLKQMVRNLVQNAIQYTPEGGSITIHLQAHTDMVVLQVADSGIGIPLDEQPHIFEKFYRATNVQSAFEGTGLGLAIVKSIVDRHEGRLWVESQPGRGSTFTVILPTHRAAAQTAGPQRRALAVSG